MQPKNGSNQKPRMTSQKGKYGRNSGLDYSRFFSDELLSFIYKRGLADRMGDHLARCLQEADQAMNFRFLDLPACVRTMVYRELFSTPDPKDICRPIKPSLRVLRTRKFIYNEAIGLAKSEASYPLSIMAVRSVNNIIIRGNGRLSTIPTSDTNDTYLKSLPNVSCLTVDISMTQDRNVSFRATDWDRLDIKGTLLGLHDLLPTQTKIRHLHLSIRTTLQSTERVSLDILSPLMALCGRMKTLSFSFSGIPDSMQRSIRATATAFMTLRSMEPEFQEVLTVRHKLDLHGLLAPHHTEKLNPLFEPCGSGRQARFANEMDLEEGIDKVQLIFKNTWKHDIDGKLKANWEKRKKDVEAKMMGMSIA